MSSVLALLVLTLGCVVARGADRLLAGAAWTWRHPRVARRLWNAAAASQLGCLVTLALLLAHDVWEHLMLWVTGAAKPDLHAAYLGDRVVSTTWNWVVLVAVIALVAPALSWSTRLRTAERRRQAHRLLPGRRQPCGDAVLLVTPAPGPFLYCLPGRRVFGARPALVIATEEAWNRLSTAERRAAVAHELAHLHRSHHRSVALAEAFAATAGRLGALPHYATELRRLIELEADDDAGRTHGRRTVARALLRLSTIPEPSHSPEAALSLGSHEIRRRVLRLLEPAVPSELALRASARTAAACLVAAPPAMLVAPLLLIL